MQYQKQEEFFKRKIETGNLSHAYIFAGPDSEGIKQFVKNLIDLVGCKFPDIITVRSADSKGSQANEKDMLEITIEQIRDVQNFLAYKSYNGGIKTVVIENAERMTKDAQDCFLKNLEEPKGQTLILLLTANPAFLLPTISSRAQVVTFLGSAADAAVDSELVKVLQGDLAEKFAYAKKANLDGGNFEKMLKALQNHFRGMGIAQHACKLKFLLDLEHQVNTSNINKKLALEVLFLNL